MPTLRGATYCTEPGCNKKRGLGSTKCPPHTKQHTRTKEARRVWREGHKMYQTKAWQRLRKLQIAGEPWCQAPHCHEPAREVDHIVPHRGDRALFHEPDNLQSLCKSCHSRKTRTEQNERINDAT